MCQVLIQDRCQNDRWTYRTSALLSALRTLRYGRHSTPGSFFSSVDSYDCTRVSSAKDTLDLRGMVNLFVSAESVTGLDEENSELAYILSHCKLAMMVPSPEYLSAGNQCPSSCTLNLHVMYLKKQVQVACVSKLVKTSWPVLTHSKHELSG